MCIYIFIYIYTPQITNIIHNEFALCTNLKSHIVTTQLKEENTSIITKLYFNMYKIISLVNSLFLCYFSFLVSLFQNRLKDNFMILSDLFGEDNLSPPSVQYGKVSWRVEGEKWVGVFCLKFL